MHPLPTAPDPLTPPPHGSTWWPKTHEQAWAAQANFPTKLAGWIILGTFLLSLIACFLPRVSGNVNLLSPIAAFYILAGHQGWLRFMTFGFCAAGVLGLMAMLIAVIFDTDLRSETGGAFSRDEPEFWTNAVAEVGVLVFQACACVLALRTRKLVFWTRRSRIWGSIGIGIILLAGAVQGWHALGEWRIERVRNAEFRAEIEASKRHIDHRGTASQNINSIESSFMGCIDDIGGIIRPPP